MLSSPTIVFTVSNPAMEEEDTPGQSTSTSDSQEYHSHGSKWESVVAPMSKQWKNEGRKVLASKHSPLVPTQAW